MRMSEVESRTGAVSTLRSLRLPSRSSNRTCGFPASGFPTGFIAGPAAPRGAFAGQYSFWKLRASWCCQAHRQSPLLDIFKARLKQGPSLHRHSRLQRYYDPLRLPPGAHRRGYEAKLHPGWVSHVARITFPTAVPTTPADRTGAVVSFPSVRPSPVSAGRHPQLHFRGLLRLHSHSAHRIARPPKAAFVTRLQPRQLPGDAARRLQPVDFSLGGSFLHW